MARGKVTLCKSIRYFAKQVDELTECKKRAENGEYFTHDERLGVCESNSKASDNNSTEIVFFPPNNAIERYFSRIFRFDNEDTKDE